jgi:hypothetical protein
MKIAGVHGSPKEIKAFFQNHGLQIEKYIERPKSPTAIGWLVTPLAVCALCLCGLLFLPQQSRLILVSLIAGLCSVVWASVAVHLRFKNSVATLITAIGLLLIVFVAGGLLTPIEALDRLRDLRK